MKKYERTLLNNLQGDTIRDEPLKNVRHAIGSIAYAKGNPLTKTEISLQITSHFFDALGNPVLPVALPVGLQTSLPVIIFSLTDFYGGFLRSRNINPITPPWVLLPNLCGIVNFTFFPVAAWIQAISESGDLVLTYIDVPGMPNVYCLIVIHCNNVAYGTFLNSFVSDLITISVMRYIVPILNINQFINPLIFGTQSLFGKLAVDSVDPRMYITSRDFQQQISDIPVNLPIDKNLMIGLQLDIFCQQISFVLFVEKIEPLTHKRFR